MKADTILHPIRLRLITALHGRSMTASEIASILPDVPQASLYRHIAILHKAGILELVDEQPVRGATEKTYALAMDESTHISAENLKGVDKDDHFRYFTSFIGSLLAGFKAYLDSLDSPEDISKEIGYTTAPIYLNQEDLGQFGEELNNVVKKYANQRIENGRKRFLFSTVVLPDIDKLKNEEKDDG